MDNKARGIRSLIWVTLFITAFLFIVKEIASAYNQIPIQEITLYRIAMIIFIFNILRAVTSYLYPRPVYNYPQPQPVSPEMIIKNLEEDEAEIKRKIMRTSDMKEIERYGDILHSIRAQKEFIINLDKSLKDFENLGKSE